MIDFSLSEEEELIRGAARDFAERRLRPAVRAHEQDGVPDTLAAEARALGLFGGHEQLGPLVHALVLEELAAADASATIALGAEAIVVDAQGALTVEDGRVWGEVALCAPASPSRVIVVRGDETLVIRTSSTAGRGDAKNTAGTTAVPALVAGCALCFDGCFAQDGPSAASVRLGQAAIFVGLARAAWEYASRYAQERVAFGKPIAQHQAVAFMLVEMAMAADLARLACWRTAHELARRSEQAPWAARAALAEGAEAAQMATERAVQLLGGHGYLKDHPVEKWMREARMLALLWNPEEEETT